MEKKYSTLNVLLITLLFSFTALAQVANDECNSAIVLQPNSPFDNCEFSTDVTLENATPSLNNLGCSSSPANDVWYEFTAINNHHKISCDTTNNSSFRLTVYSGDCDNLIPFICTDTPNAASNNFIIGQTYKIRFFSTIIPPAPGPLTFHLCISNGPKYINTNTTQYTNEQLVTDILINSSCMNVSNIAYTTGNIPGEFTGIGYFEKGETTFPFERGIVLSTGNVANISSPTSLSSLNGNNSGDIDLQQIVQTEIPNSSMSMQNASSLEFDFTPIVNSISFDFIYASNEYGVYQCNAVDPFAILLTDLTTGETVNLAVTPVTNKMIAVNNIRNSQFNTACSSLNSEYFDSFGTNTNRPINILGNTKPLTAKSAVIPGHSYHIKFVIADTFDSILNSSVFINPASFNITSIDPSEYVTLNSSNGNLLCGGENTTLSVNLDVTYTYTWSLNNEVLVGENQNSITVTDAGVYNLKIDLPQGNCSIEHNIIINTSTSSAINQIVIPDLIDFSQNVHSHYFNLTTVTDQIVSQPGNENYTITYHLTTTDAETNSNPLGTAYGTSANPKTIYARISNGSCFKVKSFNLIFIAPPTGESYQNFSEGETLANLEVIGENIKWYDTHDVTEVTPLPLATLLTDGMSYYASQTVNGMENPYRFEVTTSLILGLKNNTFTNLYFYPNPVNDILNITNTIEIEEAIVYNYLGQAVMNLQTNSTDVNINMSRLEQGIYLIKIKSDGKQKTLKVIKY